MDDRAFHRQGKGPLVIVLLAGAVASATALWACSNPDTQTPACNNNVNQYGIYPDQAGCNEFAYCDGGDYLACCGGADGGLMGNELAACRHGFGDPACAYLINYVDGGNVDEHCSATPPAGTGDGG